MLLALVATTPKAKAATGELGVRAVVVSRSSVLAISKLRTLQLELSPQSLKSQRSLPLQDDAVFSLPQTRNYHLSYTRKLFRCETIACESAGQIPGQELAPGDISVRVVATNINQLSVKARGDKRFDIQSKPFLSPLTVIVSYE